MKSGHDSLEFVKDKVPKKNKSTKWLILFTAVWFLANVTLRYTFSLAIRPPREYHSNI